MQAQDVRHSIDSIEAQLPHLDAQERLEALSDICDYAFYLDDAPYEQKCLRRLFREAEQMGDKHTASYAYANLMCSFYNHNMYDELVAELPASLAYLEHAGSELYYFETRQLLIDMYLYLEKNYQALNEMQKMYDDAKKNNSLHGQAIALAKMGSAFGIIYRDLELAAESHAKAIELFSKNDYISGEEMNTYFEYAYILHQLNRWDELRAATDLWKERLDRLNEKQQAKGSASNTREYYLNFDAMMVIMESKLKNFSLATKYFTALKADLKDCPVSILPMIYEAHEIYFTALGQYDSALYYNQKNYELALEAGNTANSTDVISARAEIFMQMEKYDSAARLFDRFVTLRDSVEEGDNRELLNEFRTLSQVHEVEAAQRQFRTRLFLTLGVILLVGLFVFLLIDYSRRLSRRNKILYDAIQSNLLEQEIITPSELRSKSAATVSGEYEKHLYERLCQLMEEKTPYSNPALNRDSLAEMLGTNRNLLAEAVRLHQKDTNLVDFINRYRVKHAAKLLADYPQMQITDVELVSGFNSHATFNRLFKQHFGMSPTEYRNIALEYKQRRIS